MINDKDLKGCPSVERHDKELHGYHSLWTECLNQAIASASKVNYYKAKKTNQIGTARAYAYEDLAWILSPDLKAGSFLWICEELGISLKTIDKIKKYVFSQPAKLNLRSKPVMCSYYNNFSFHKFRPSRKIKINENY